MSVPNLDPLRASLEARIEELEDEQKRQEQRHEGNGNTPAVWDKSEPKIRRDIVGDCLEELHDVDDRNDLLRIVAEWRRNENREWNFNQNSSRWENERNRIKKAEIRTWQEKLVDRIPDSEFKTCGRCESLQMPKSNRRRSRRFVWECPDCF